MFCFCFQGESLPFTAFPSPPEFLRPLVCPGSGRSTCSHLKGLWGAALPLPRHVPSHPHSVTAQSAASPATVAGGRPSPEPVHSVSRARHVAAGGGAGCGARRGRPWPGGSRTPCPQCPKADGDAPFWGCRTAARNLRAPLTALNLLETRFLPSLWAPWPRDAGPWESVLATSRLKRKPPTRSGVGGGRARPPRSPQGHSPCSRPTCCSPHSGSVRALLPSSSCHRSASSVPF